MSATNKLNGAQVIVDYLIQEKVPYVFGLCGHGNIQFIDALYERSSDIKTISDASRERLPASWRTCTIACRGQPVATFTSCGPGSANLPIALGERLSRLGAVPRGHRQRADQPVQSRRVSGNVPPLPGRLSIDGAQHLQARVPADARRNGAARGAAGVEDDGDRPAGSGRARRALRRVHGGRCRGGAEPAGLERATSPAAAAPIPKASSRRSTCCSMPSDR